MFRDGDPSKKLSQPGATGENEPTKRKPDLTAAAVVSLAIIAGVVGDQFFTGKNNNEFSQRVRKLALSYVPQIRGLAASDPSAQVSSHGPIQFKAGKSTIAENTNSVTYDFKTKGSHVVYSLSIDRASKGPDKGQVVGVDFDQYNNKTLDSYSVAFSSAEDDNGAVANINTGGNNVWGIDVDRDKVTLGDPVQDTVTSYVEKPHYSTDRQLNFTEIARFKNIAQTMMDDATPGQNPA
jgi:hypothetical protein